MPTGAPPSLQLDLFLRDTTAYQQALARYERLRPMLQGQATLTQQSQATGIPYNQWWRDLQRFQRAGLVGLLDHRTLPHTRGTPSLDERIPLHVQHQIVRLALAHPFTARELARIVQTCYELPIDHRGIRRVLDLHQLSPAVLRLHYQTTQQATLPPFSAGQQLDLAWEPTTHAQRLLQALGPDHLLRRFRTYREYPTEEQARWRIIELLEVGFRPRRVAKLLGLQVPVVYYWQRRFQALGLVGLTTQTRTDTPITMRVSVQALMDVFQLLDNNPLLGHYRVKMALDSLGYRYGHTTVWQMVALYKQAHPRPLREPRVPNPAERPKATTAPHQAWFVDLRYLVQIAGQWLYSVLIFDGYSRAIVGAGCFERQNFSRILHVFRQALTQWGAPEAVVSDHGAVFVALAPCLRQLDIQWAPTTKGHPWQNRAESGCAIQRRMLDASVVGCTEREQVYQRHAQFVRDDQFWGHWAHKRQDAPGRVYYLSPEVMLGQARGRALDPRRLRRALRLRQLPRTVRQYGQIRLYNFGLYVDQGLWGHTVEVWVYDDVVRMEQGEQVVVSYPCVYDPRQRRITDVAAPGRQQYGDIPTMQWMLFTLALVRTVWRMPRYRRIAEPRRVLLAPQISLWQRFADYRVQIRIEGSRTLHASAASCSLPGAGTLC
jgi:transposase